MKQGYFLAGHSVTQEMYGQVASLRRNGAKISLLLPEVGADGCTNCGGSGHLALEVIVGGPFKAPKSEIHGHGDRANEVATATRIGDKWCKRNIFSHPCPVCDVNKRRIVDDAGTRPIIGIGDALKDMA